MFYLCFQVFRRNHWPMTFSVSNQQILQKHNISFGLIMAFIKFKILNGKSSDTSAKPINCRCFFTFHNNPNDQNYSRNINYFVKSQTWFCSHISEPKIFYLIIDWNILSSLVHLNMRYDLHFPMFNSQMRFDAQYFGFCNPKLNLRKVIERICCRWLL